MSNTSRTRATQVGALAFIAVALMCAAFAAFLVNRMISAKGYTGDRVRPVVVARHALPAAKPITPEDVQVVNWPEKSIPPGVVADASTLFADAKLLIPTTAILQGEPIVPSRLASSAQGTGLAALVREGYRAVAVMTDEAVGRARLVYPGAYVDVLATIRDPQGRGPSTRIAVADAKVLAVEQETDVATHRDERDQGLGEAANKSSRSGTVVTLEVTPEDAEVLSLAAREGRVDLALRNGSDRKPVETRGAIPLMFSAFAPDVAIEGTTPEGETPAASASPGRSVPMKGGRIELRAVDSRRERRENNDRQNDQGIETYRAR